MNQDKYKLIENFFNELNNETMDLIDEFYDKDVQFQDPVGLINGRESLKNYYKGMYENVHDIRFEFTDHVERGESIVVFWVMYLKCSGLNGGKEVSLDGSSLIKFNASNNKVSYHRDYFDMGEFIYEKIPVLRWVIGVIKNKLSIH